MGPLWRQVLEIGDDAGSLLPLGAARPGGARSERPVARPPRHFVPAESPSSTRRKYPSTWSLAACVARLSTAATPLVVLSAGAGKTLTVRQWLQTDPRPVVWLRLDAGDNDPVTLLHTLRALS